MATGQRILEQLQKLTPEELALPCVHVHTEYADPEDSMGHEVDGDIDSVYVEYATDRYGYLKKDKPKRIRFGL